MTVRPLLVSMSSPGGMNYTQLYGGVCDLRLRKVDGLVYKLVAQQQTKSSAQCTSIGLLTFFEQT